MISPKVAGLLLLISAVTLDGEAQTRRTVLQFHLIGTTDSPEFGGAGIGLFHRPPGRLSFGVVTSPGVSGGAFTLRSEGVLLFSLDPGRQSGLAPYGGGGLVWRWSRERSSGFLLVLLGLESAPRSASGWFAEIGVGGGLRGAVGWRFRS